MRSKSLCQECTLFLVLGEVGHYFRRQFPSPNGAAPLPQSPALAAEQARIITAQRRFRDFLKWGPHDNF